MVPTWRHCGNALQPRKRPPALGPFFASRSTDGLPHRRRALRSGSCGAWSSGNLIVHKPNDSGLGGVERMIWEGGARACRKHPKSGHQHGCLKGSLPKETQKTKKGGRNCRRRLSVCTNRGPSFGLFRFLRPPPPPAEGIPVSPVSWFSGASKRLPIRGTDAIRGSNGPFQIHFSRFRK